VRLWDTLRLVPLAAEGVVTIDGHADVVAVVMRRLIPLAELSREISDVRVLLRVSCQVAEVGAELLVRLVVVVGWCGGGVVGWWGGGVVGWWGGGVVRSWGGGVACRVNVWCDAALTHADVVLRECCRCCCIRYCEIGGRRVSCTATSSQPTSWWSCCLHQGQ
jgi:hypothetical protein